MSEFMTARDKTTEPTGEKVAEAELCATGSEHVSRIGMVTGFYRQFWFIYQSFIRELSNGVSRTDSLRMMKKKSLDAMKRKAALWLRQGISPGRLALTLALGFAIGCSPILGVTTGLCAVIALALGLNLAAIQAANYLAMPIQLAMVVPFVRIGGKIFTFGSRQAIEAGALLHTPPLAILSRMSGLAGQALLAWLLFAIPAVALLTLMLTAILRRIPAVANQQPANG